MAYNTSKHASHDHSPFYLNHGREASSTLDRALSLPNRTKNVETHELVSTLSLHWRLARDAVSMAQQFHSYFANRRIDIPDYKIGDMVWLSVRFLKTHLRARTQHKFQRQYIGPFKIIERLHDTSFRLDLPKAMKIHNVFYGGLLKPFYGKIEAHGEAKPASKRFSDVLYPVRAILNSRVRRRKKQYLIQWLGYEEGHNTWEPESSLIQYIPKMIEEFERRAAEEKTKRERRKASRRRR